VSLRSLFAPLEHSTISWRHFPSQSLGAQNSKNGGLRTPQERCLSLLGVGGIGEKQRTLAGVVGEECWVKAKGAGGAPLREWLFIWDLCFLGLGILPRRPPRPPWLTMEGRG
jgi:hypothetical protein